MSGPIIVDGSTASPTRTLRTAAASRGRNVGSSYTGRVEDGEARGRALLAGVAERRADDVADRRVHVGRLR